jgi:hypothetical protein
MDQLRFSQEELPPGSGNDYSEVIEKLKKAIEVTTHAMETNTKVIAEHSNSLHTHSEEIEALKGKMRIVEGKFEDIESRPIASLIPFGDFDDVKETADDLLSPDDVVNAADHNSLKAKVRTMEKRLDSLCQQLPPTHVKISGKLHHFCVCFFLAFVSVVCLKYKDVEKNIQELAKAFEALRGSINSFEDEMGHLRNTPRDNIVKEQVVVAVPTVTTNTTTALPTVTTNTTTALPTVTTTTTTAPIAEDVIVKEQVVYAVVPPVTSDDTTTVHTPDQTRQVEPTPKLKVKVEPTPKLEVKVEKTKVETPKVEKPKLSPYQRREMAARLVEFQDLIIPEAIQITVKIELIEKDLERLLREQEETGNMEYATQLRELEDKMESLKKLESDIWGKLKMQLNNWKKELENRLLKEIADGLNGLPAPASEPTTTVPGSPSKRMEWEHMVRKLKDSIAGDMLRMSKELEAGTNKVHMRVDPVENKLAKLFIEIDGLKLGLARVGKGSGGGGATVEHGGEQLVVNNYVTSGDDYEALIRLERKQSEIDDELLKHSSSIATLFEQFASLENRTSVLDQKQLQLEDSVAVSIQKQAQEIAALIAQKAEQGKAISDLYEKKVRKKMKCTIINSSFMTLSLRPKMHHCSFFIHSLIVKADVEDLKKKADVSLVNTKVDHKLMQVTIQRSMTPLESAFSNFMDLMKKQMENAVSQNELGKVWYLTSNILPIIYTVYIYVYIIYKYQTVPIIIP